MYRQYLDMLSATVIACLLMFVTVSSTLAQPISEPWNRAEIVKVWCSGEREARITSFQSLLEDVVVADAPAQQWAANLIGEYRDGNFR
jgi:hypothetical protein